MAQVKFSASISPAQIGKNEYAQLKLSVENAKDVEQISPPALKDFDIISGPNQENGMSMVNGVVKRYIALSFVIRPRNTGTFTIPSAMAKADGKELKSNPVELKVTATGSGNNQGANTFMSPFGSMDPFAEPAPESAYRDNILKKGEDPREKISKNMFVKLEVDKTSCYVGEPVVATYKLYTRLKSESNMTRQPSFNGFSVIDLLPPNSMDSHVERVGGREYNVYVIRKVQLYPLLAGVLEPGTTEIENTVHFIKAEYADRQTDVFGEMFRDFANAAIPPEGMEDHKVSLENKPVSITVKPLPDANKPIPFKGAVGNFKVEMKIEKDSFSTDDAGRLAVIISGEGNLQLVNAPEITWPEGLEGFDPKSVEDLYKTTVPVSGRKIYEFPFTAARPGTYSIPALEFSFFDLRDQKYKTISTKPIQVQVSKGTGKPGKQDVEIVKPEEEHFLAWFFRSRLRVVSVIAILIICGLIIWLRRDNKKEKDAVASVAAGQADQDPVQPDEQIMQNRQNPLEAVEKNLYGSDSRAFYMELNQAFKNYLSQKLSIQPEALNKKNISEQLDKRGVAHETSIQLHQLMDDIEWQLYTPFAENEKMREIYERANAMVQLLNTYRS